MNLVPLPAFTDNYIWMLHDGARAVVVDPGDAAPVHQALDESGLKLAAILVTHHHADHIGGVNAFALAAEPGDAALAAYQARCIALREAAQPTLPSSIGLELAINPFLRCTEPEVVASARAQGAAAVDAISVLAAVREWKNRYQ